MPAIQPQGGGGARAVTDPKKLAAANKLKPVNVTKPAVRPKPQGGGTSLPPDREPGAGVRPVDPLDSSVSATADNTPPNPATAIKPAPLPPDGTGREIAPGTEPIPAPPVATMPKWAAAKGLTQQQYDDIKGVKAAKPTSKLPAWAIKRGLTDADYAAFKTPDKPTQDQPPPAGPPAAQRPKWASGMSDADYQATLKRNQAFNQRPPDPAKSILWTPVSAQMKPMPVPDGGPEATPPQQELPPNAAPQPTAGLADVVAPPVAESAGSRGRWGGARRPPRPVRKF